MKLIWDLLFNEINLYNMAKINLLPTRVQELAYSIALGLLSLLFLTPSITVRGPPQVMPRKGRVWLASRSRYFTSCSSNIKLQEIAID